VECAGIARVASHLSREAPRRGKILFRLVGPHRRVLLEDLRRYTAQEEAERHRALDERGAEAQKLGMY